MKPRGGAGLLDLLTMRLVPPLEGIYRQDIEPPGLWSQFRSAPGYRRLERPQGILLSHAHLDHSGHIGLLRQDIPIYTTFVTAFLTKAIQDSGKADFDQQVCYFSPMARDMPAGWKQEALLSAQTEVKQQRQFCIDIDPQKLGQEAMRFWERGFWEKTTKQKGLRSCALNSHGDCCFEVRCFPVDHSIPGACAWGIKTTSGWIVYSGDLRLHGKRSALTRRFIEEAAALRPRALILEGTNVLRPSNVSEHEVFENASKAIASASGLVIADFSARDVDRLITFLDIARAAGRKLAVLARDAYLLKTMRLLEPATPDVARDDNLFIYQETTASKSPAHWLRNVFEEYNNKVVLAADVQAAQDDFILCFSFFDLNELPGIRPRPGSLYLFSSSEPHDEEQEIDFRRLHNWLDHFAMRGFGVPVEDEHGWAIPEDERGVHASGHACGPDLVRLATEIAPEIVIPVHSEHPDYYSRQLAGRDIAVALPAPGGSIDLDEV